MTTAELLNALDRMDALLDAETGLLTVSQDSATVKACRADMRLIRAHLAQPQAEPVGHLHSNDEFCLDRRPTSDSWPINLYTHPTAPAPQLQAEPVAWRCNHCGNVSAVRGMTTDDNWCNSCATCGDMEPLYLHPAAPVPARCDGGTCGAGGYCKDCPKQQAPAPADEQGCIACAMCGAPHPNIREVVVHADYREMWRQVTKSNRELCAALAAAPAPAVPPVALTPLTEDERAMLHDAVHIINRAARTKGDHWDCVGSLLTRIADHGITQKRALTDAEIGKGTP